MDRLVRITPGDYTPQHRSDGFRCASHTQLDTGKCRRILGQWPIRLRLRFVSIQFARKSYICYDADDFLPGGFGRISVADAFAERAFVRPAAPCHGFVDDHNVGLVRHIAFGKETTFLEPDTDRFKIARTDGFEAGKEMLSLGSRRPAIEGDIAKHPRSQNGRPRGKRHALHSRNHGEPFFKFLEENAALLRCSVFGRRKIHSAGQQAIHPPTWIALHELLKPADKRPRACQQHERKSHFADDERVLPALLANAAGISARAFLQMTIHVVARSEPRRRCSEQDSGDYAAKQGESQHANIKWNRKTGFATDGEAMPDEIFRPHRQQQTERAAEQRHQQTFSKQLPKQPRSTSTQCNANREFTRASSEAGQEEISKIGARDQQYGACETKTEPHDRALLFGGRVAQRQRAQPITRLSFRVLLGEASRQRLHLRVGLGDGNARLEPAKRETPLVSAALTLTGCESKWPQNVHLCPEQRIIKLLGHHTHDGDILAIESQRAPAGFSVALKAILPKLVAENDNLAVSCPVLLLRETASEFGLNSEG